MRLPDVGTLHGEHVSTPPPQQQFPIPHMPQGIYAHVWLMMVNPPCPSGIK